MDKFKKHGFIELSTAVNETIKDVSELKVLFHLAGIMGIECKETVIDGILKSIRLKENDYLTVRKQFKND